MTDVPNRKLRRPIDEPNRFQTTCFLPDSESLSGRVLYALFGRYCEALVNKIRNSANPMNPKLFLDQVFDRGATSGDPTNRSEVPHDRS